MHLKNIHFGRFATTIKIISDLNILNLKLYLIFFLV